MEYHKKQLGHLDLIRRINRAAILNIIKSDQPISRAQVAKRLELSKATVSAIVDELMETHLIVESEPSANTGTDRRVGRPSRMLTFNPKATLCVGITIKGDHLQGILTDLEGEILNSGETEFHKKPQEVPAFVRDLLDGENIRPEDLHAIGVGVPGTVDSKGMVLTSSLLDWQRVDLKSMLENELQVSVFVENDVNLQALGERWLGAGNQDADVFFLSFEDGIGSAIICDGRMIHGCRYIAGEVEYLIESGDVASLPNYENGEWGVFEKYCAPRSFAKNQRSYADIFAEDNPERDAFLTRIAVVIANAVSMLNPSSVIIGGKYVREFGQVIEELQWRIKAYTPIPVILRLAELGENAEMLGAVNYACERKEQMQLSLFV